MIPGVHLTYCEVDFLPFEALHSLPPSISPLQGGWLAQCQNWVLNAHSREDQKAHLSHHGVA